MCETNCSIIASDQSWIEGEAVRQLEQTATLTGMKRTVGMPDLHPGKGTPIGAAFYAEGMIYPHLVGNDIGCGMGLWQTGLPVHRLKLDKAVNKLTGLDEFWEGDFKARIKTAGLSPSLSDMALGTIGGGNHFAELQRVEEIHDAAAFARLGLQADNAVLLVHSGSRGLGETILRRHVEKSGASGLPTGTPECEGYLTHHDNAVKWAVLNRAVIAERFMQRLGTDGNRAVDICHNSVTASGQGWLHRKGAAPADAGAVVIPGSRGAITYLVAPTDDTGHALHSLAHGAGRKWKRSDAKAKLGARYKVTDLTRTKLGGRVICEDKDLIFEEAPEAYKDIESVIADLKGAGLISVIATFRPIITYKTRRK